MPIILILPTAERRRRAERRGQVRTVERLESMADKFGRGIRRRNARTKKLYNAGSNSWATGWRRTSR